jgi:DnaJ-class molecular chaperone
MSIDEARKTNPVACYPCEGRGWITNEHGDRVECEWCDGSGSSVFNPYMPCPTCGHASTFHEADGRCPTE